MDRPAQRPRLDLAVDLPLDEVVARLAAGLAADRECTGRVSRRHAWIHVVARDHHLWSPTLDLSLEPTPTGVRLHGRFGPEPEVWTVFVFTYAALGLAAVLGAVFGLVQLGLGQAPWGLLVAAASVALSAFVYGAAFIGQGLGSPQIVQIRLFLDRTLDRPHPVVPAGSAGPPGHRAGDSPQG